MEFDQMINQGGVSTMLGLTTWNPFNEIYTIQKELDNLFDRIWGDTVRSRFVTGLGFQSHMTRPWYPAMECFVKGEELVVRAVLPGIDPKEVDISVLGNQLILKGERKPLEGMKSEDYYFSEIPYGKFERTITLPRKVDAEQIHAKYKDGVLEITLPASDIVPKKVPVMVETGEKALNA